MLLALIAWQVAPGLLPQRPIPAPAGGRSLEGGAGSWGYVHGDAAGARATSAEVELAAGSRWDTSVGGLSAPAVAGTEAVFLPVADGRLTALAIEDGRVLWERGYEFALTAAPTLAGDRLYVLDRAGAVEALNAGTGEVVWQSELLGAYGVAPVVVDGSVYLFFGLDNAGQQSGLVAQVDAESGRVLWRGAASRAFPATAMAVGDRSVAVVGGHILELYDRRFGERTFWFNFRYGVEAVAIQGDAAYVVTTTETASLSLDATRPWWDGVRGFWVNLSVHGMAPQPPPVPSNWIVRAEPREPLAPVVTGSALIVADRGGTLRAHDLASGAEVWSSHGASITAAPLLTADGLLVVRGADLSLVDPVTGAVIEERARAAGGAITQVAPADGGIVTITETGGVALLAP